MLELLDDLGRRYGCPPTVFESMDIEARSRCVLCMRAGQARQAREIQDTKVGMTVLVVGA